MRPFYLIDKMEMSFQILRQSRIIPMFLDNELVWPLEQMCTVMKRMHTHSNSPIKILLMNKIESQFKVKVRVIHGTISII